MINLAKAILPSAIEVEGNFFAIQTDFHYWIRFSQMLKETHILLDYDFLYVDEKPFDRQKGFEKLVEFYAPRNVLPRATSSDDNKTVLDYQYDGDLIYSAFMQMYNLDLVESHIHWHKFKALLAGIKDTKLNDVISYRCYTKTNKSYESAMNEMKASWEITQEMELTQEEREKLEQFNNSLK